MAHEDTRSGWIDGVRAGGGGAIHAGDGHGQDCESCSTTGEQSMGRGLWHLVRASDAVQLCGDGVVYLWDRHLGSQCAGGVGICDYQFCVVDRDRTCGDVYLGVFIVAAAGVADEH